MKRSVILSVTALAIVVAACTSAASPSPARPRPAPSPSPELGDIVATAMVPAPSRRCSPPPRPPGLVETLQGDGPFTVFAPTDEAFAALPAGTLDGLLADPEALKQILLYHVVSGKVTAATSSSLTSADSVEGSPIAIAVKDGKVYLNDSAQVVATDVMASNGVIHVIDQVILPPAAEATPSPSMRR